MKRLVQTTGKRRAKRDLFAELIEGFRALADMRRGKRTLRTHTVEIQPTPKKHGPKTR